jgi:hypothetical protein
MRNRVLVVVSLLCACSVASAQQLLVFPAVTDEVPGLNDSLWVTMVRIVKADPRDAVTIRRTWVCLPGGGFVDDPATAPTWIMQSPPTQARLLILSGHELLSDTGANLGAVGVEVEGGEVLAHAYVVDVLRGVYAPPLFAVGQGQLIPPYEAPMQGRSHIPWLGGCANYPCSQDPPDRWDHLRNNIGIVNANPEALSFSGTVVALGWAGVPTEIPDGEPETFVKEVPPYGWVQFHWQAEHRYGLDQWGEPIVASFGFVISLTPDKDLPYYAYASVVFTPDPESGVDEFNDPMYVPARPGYVAPFSEVIPPQ